MLQNAQHHNHIYNDTLINTCNSTSKCNVSGYKPRTQPHSIQTMQWHGRWPPHSILVSQASVSAIVSSIRAEVHTVQMGVEGECCTCLSYNATGVMGDRHGHLGRRHVSDSCLLCFFYNVHCVCMCVCDSIITAMHLNTIMKSGPLFYLAAM